MARLKPWREVVTQAIQGHGGKPVTNDSVYAKVAKLIGAKTLTSNQKAKVRQQLQLVAKKPRGKKKGVWKYEPKLPQKPGIQLILDTGASFGHIGEFFEKETAVKFQKGHKTYVYQFAIGETGLFVTSLMPIAEKLQLEYGKVDTSVEFLTTVVKEDKSTGEQWWHLAYGGSPEIAAGQAPAAVQDFVKKTEQAYRGAIDEMIAFSFTLYVKT